MLIFNWEFENLSHFENLIIWEFVNLRPREVNGNTDKLTPRATPVRQNHSAYVPSRCRHAAAVAGVLLPRIPGPFLTRKFSNSHILKLLVAEFENLRIWWCVWASRKAISVHSDAMGSRNRLVGNCHWDIFQAHKSFYGVIFKIWFSVKKCWFSIENLRIWVILRIW